MKPFFEPVDFASLRRRDARTDKSAVISDRKDAVTKLKELHRDHLATFMRQHDLHPHPNRDYWTNVFFPKTEANGGSVDYLRFGYGKEGRLVKLMAERAGFAKVLLPGGATNDQMAFHYAAQVQIGLTVDYWWFNFYVDDKAWLENANLLAKIQTPVQRHKCEALLAALQDEGYELRLWSAEEPDIENYPRETPAAFLDELSWCRQQRKSVNVDIELQLDPDNPQNDMDQMPEMAKRQFAKLIPLYRFWAWHPQSNSHVPGLE